MKKVALLILVISPLFLSAYFLFLKDPPIWPDEGTSLFMAKSILETGQINASIYLGIPQLAIKTGLGFPPLYFTILGAWTNIFGETIEAIRSLSLVLGVFTVITFFFLTKEALNSSKWAFWGSLLLSFNVHFGKASRFGRPEMLTLFLFLLSLYFLQLSSPPRNGVRGKLRRGSNSEPDSINWIPAFAGMTCASLATISHPLGLIAPIVLSLHLRKKIIHLLGLIITVLAFNLAWILLTQQSPSDLIQTYQLASLGKLARTSALWVLLTSTPPWIVFIISQATLLIALAVLTFHKKTSSLYLLLISILLTLIWVASQKEGYYLVYLQPLLILGLLQFKKLSLVLFFLIINIYLQFFFIDSYTPAKNIFNLSSFDYHQLADQVQQAIENTSGVGLDSPEVKILLSSIPDLFLDLRKNPNYTIYQAIDPNFPLDEEAYQKSLENIDYVIFTWLPHDLLALYVNTHSEQIIQVGSPDGYMVNIAKLKPKNQRN